MEVTDVVVRMSGPRVETVWREKGVRSGYRDILDMPLIERAEIVRHHRLV